MKTVKNSCALQPNALNINVGDQIEQLDELIHSQDGESYFEKTFITEGMRTLLRKGIARLSGNSNDTVFHLKQAMGGGKTHLMVALGVLATNPQLRSKIVGDIPHVDKFEGVKLAAFNGRNDPDHFLWGEIAAQLGKPNQFKRHWENGPCAPDENDWLELFDDENPILILLDEMPPYFQNQMLVPAGQGTRGDIVTRAFSNMLTAAQKKSNVCIVVSDLDAAYRGAGKAIRGCLDDAAKELGRAEISITPVSLESNEIFEILRKRLFISMPSVEEISDLANLYAERLSEAAKADSTSKSCEAISQEIESTYPFHPSFKSIVALFKDNEKFMQTRGLMEIVSRLLKSVWESNEEVYLIGSQHFNLNIGDVREKLSDISEMRDVISKDIWDQSGSAHAQIIDQNSGNKACSQISTLLLTASLSDSISSFKGLSDKEIVECLIDPIMKVTDIQSALRKLLKTAWFLHQGDDNRIFFDKRENLTKKLQSYADKAPQIQIDNLIKESLERLYAPKSKEAYTSLLALPDMAIAEAAIKRDRCLLIIKPDGKNPPKSIKIFFDQIVEKNNFIVLSGERSIFGDLEEKARFYYATLRLGKEIQADHPQYADLEDKSRERKRDYFTTISNVFNKLTIPSFNKGKAELRSIPLNFSANANTEFNGEEQVIKTLTDTSVNKLHTNIEESFAKLQSRAEGMLFTTGDIASKSDLMSQMKRNTRMVWMPPRGLDNLIRSACDKGLWEDLGDSRISKTPQPKKTSLHLHLIEEGENGMKTLRIETSNAGSVPKVHYQENGHVTEQSPIVKSGVINTKALRIQFLVIDQTGANITGDPHNWQNEIEIGYYMDENTRTLELSATLEADIRYSLDGSNPRNGKLYSDKIKLPDSAGKILIFAEKDGIEASDEKAFSAVGKKIEIDPIKPANISLSKKHKIDNNAQVYRTLDLAENKGITLKAVKIITNSNNNYTDITFSKDIEVHPKKLRQFIELSKDDHEGECEVSMAFSAANLTQGVDAEEFKKVTGIKSDDMEISQ